MKKSIIIIGASLLLVSGLTAGVFARYESTLPTIASGSVEKKKFVFVNGSEESVTSGKVSLAPGESGSLEFKVRNYDEYSVSQVDMKVDFTCSLNGALADETDSEGNKLLTYVITSDNDENTFSANVKGEINAKITFKLSEDATIAVIGKTCTFEVSAKATQII